MNYKYLDLTYDEVLVNFIISDIRLTHLHLLSKKGEVEEGKAIYWKRLIALKK